MARRVRRKIKLSEEAEAMLSQSVELTRIPPVFRRSPHQNKIVVKELREAGLFKQPVPMAPRAAVPLSGRGIELARTIRTARLSLEPKRSEPDDE